LRVKPQRVKVFAPMLRTAWDQCHVPADELAYGGPAPQAKSIFENKLEAISG
jgi:hypothetical protein